MAVDIVMPRLSDTMESGKVLHWLKKEGEEVQKGEPLVEIETDKANMELEAYESGRLQKIVVGEGQSVPIGELIATIETTLGEQPSAPEAKPLAEAPEHVAPSAAIPEKGRMSSERIKVSPLARRIAEEQGIDLSKVNGTGPGGRITREDVEGFIETKPEARPAAISAPEAPKPVPVPEEKAPLQEKAPAPGVEMVDLSRMGATIAKRMAESKAPVPHYYLTSEVDMTSAIALRKELNSSVEPSPALSINDLVIKAVAIALARYPQANAFYRDGKLEMHRYVHIGIAVALEDGLVVPVIHNCEQKSLRQIADETKGLYERTRSGRLLPDDYEGGTFSVSNLGMYDVDKFTAIINPPQSGILAIGSVKRKPVVINDQITISDRMVLTLSSDHRVYYGSTAAVFLREIKRLLENPYNLLI